MKKCMITALAVVVASGAFAACQRGKKEDGSSCDKQTWVYTWKFSGKTTKGAKVSEKEIKKLCDREGGEDGYVRVPASLKIQGYVGYCDVYCGSEAFEVIDPTNEIFWQTKPEKVAFTEGGPSLEVSNIIGKKAKQYEVFGKAKFVGALDNDPNSWAIEYDLTLAGLGKYDKKNDRVSSASGNFAGTLEYPYYVSSKNGCQYAGIWSCCDFSLVEDPKVLSVAYGKWNVKYNKKLSKKLKASGDFGDVVAAAPKWAR